VGDQCGKDLDIDIGMDVGTEIGNLAGQQSLEEHCQPTHLLRGASGWLNFN